MSEREMVKRAKEIEIELKTLRAIEQYLITRRLWWTNGYDDATELKRGAQLALDAAIDRVKLMQWERE